LGSQKPHGGTYEGTEGYVAPDLRLGQDRKYSEDGDLYAVAVTLHEWLVGNRPGDGVSPSPGVSTTVLDWLRKGSSLDAAQRFASINQMREALETALAWKEPADTTAPMEVVPSNDQESARLEVNEPEDLEALPWQILHVRRHSRFR